MCRPPGAGIGAIEGAWRAIAASRAARRRAYSVRMRRTCGASRPWRMNSARIAWLSVSMPRSISVPQPHERRHQRRRHHGEAQAQRRRQSLAERAAVDHPAGAIERGQRRQRMAAPAELRIAVVLQDPGIGAARPVEQRQPPADRQRAAQRRGVRWRHQRQPRVGRALDAGGDVEPLGVARHRDRRRRRRRAARRGRRCSRGPPPRRHRRDRAAVPRRCAAPAGCRRSPRCWPDRPAGRAWRPDGRRSGRAVPAGPAAADSR